MQKGNVRYRNKIQHEPLFTLLLWKSKIIVESALSFKWTSLVSNSFHLFYHFREKFFVLFEIQSNLRMKHKHKYFIVSCLFSCIMNRTFYILLGVRFSYFVYFYCFDNIINILCRSMSLFTLPLMAIQSNYYYYVYVEFSVKCLMSGLYFIGFLGRKSIFLIIMMYRYRK